MVTADDSVIRGKGSFLRKGMILASCLGVILAMSGCHSTPRVESGPLVQRGYLWQREWTPEVAEAMQEADKHLDGVVVLGAEIVWEGKTARALKANLSWQDLKQAQRPCAIGVRIAPYPGPFAEDDAQARAIVDVVKSLLDEARAHGVTFSECQIDFDCGEKKLEGYHQWLRALIPVVHPTRLVITTLPAWLDEWEFPALVREVDGYVLQVHSVPTRDEGGQAMLCDPMLARKWVSKASSMGMPFSVALPTYRCLAGYDPSGKLLGVAMDSVEPAWPQGTRVLEFGTNADDMAGLVKEWSAERPSGLREVLWYRLPVATDLRNWRWVTLLAVMQGRKPVHRLEVIQTEINPVDFSIINTGEAEEQLDCDVIVKWNNSKLVACDALPGWKVLPEKERATFTTMPDSRLSLSPGAKLSLGWLRLDPATAVQTEILPHEKDPR